MLIKTKKSSTKLLESPMEKRFDKAYDASYKIPGLPGKSKRSYKY